MNGRVWRINSPRCWSIRDQRSHRGRDSVCWLEDRRLQTVSSDHKTGRVRRHILCTQQQHDIFINAVIIIIIIILHHTALWWNRHGLRDHIMIYCPVFDNTYFIFFSHFQKKNKTSYVFWNDFSKKRKMSQKVSSLLNVYRNFRLKTPGCYGYL